MPSISHMFAHSIGALALLAAAAPASAQQPVADRDAVVAIADSALAAISRGDMTGFTDLMVPEAVLFPTSTRDGVTRYAVRTRAEQRAAATKSIITERGWAPEVHVSGGVASVWYPYDLYLDGQWSHCGADVFTLVRQGSGWRILSMAWSAEQPPVCTRHPKGPPAEA